MLSPLPKDVLKKMNARGEQGLLGEKKKKKKSDMEERDGQCVEGVQARAGPTPPAGFRCHSRSSTEGTAPQATGRCPWRVPSRPFYGQRNETQRGGLLNPYKLGDSPGASLNLCLPF